MKIALIAIGDRPENYTFRLFKSLLEKRNNEVHLIYLNIGRMDSAIGLTTGLKNQLSHITEGSGLIGMYVFTFNFFLAAQLTDYLRSAVNSLIIWGGPHAIAEPEECCRHADIVCMNEGEEALIRIVEELEKKGRGFDKSGIPNIAYTSDGKVRLNAVRRVSFSLNTLPYQDFSFNRHYYVNRENKLAPFTLEAAKEAYGGKLCYITMMARGCRCRCGFCLNSKDTCIPYNMDRSVDNVIGELIEAKKSLREEMTVVTLYDDDFFALPLDRIKEFCDKYRRHIGLPMKGINATAAFFSEDKLAALEDAGVVNIVLGVQSISENGRRSYNNPATKEKITRIMEVMKRHPRVEVVLNIILGNPYETEDDIAENLLFLESLPKIYRLSAYQLIIYPGTKLHEAVKNDPRHSHRAGEGYHLPYYYPKPELAAWNILVNNYLDQKRGLPGHIRFMLNNRLYSLLKLTVYFRFTLPSYVRLAIAAVRKRGFVGAAKRAVERIGS